MSVSQLLVAVGKKKKHEKQRKDLFGLQFSEFGSWLLRLFVDCGERGLCAINVCGVKSLISWKETDRQTDKGERREERGRGGGKEGRRRGSREIRYIPVAYFLQKLLPPDRHKFTN